MRSHLSSCKKHFGKTTYLLICVLCVLMLLCVAYIMPSTASFWSRQIPVDDETVLVDSSTGITLHLRSRRDVLTHTSWGAPIMWEGIFQAEQYDESHQRNRASVALTVFAVGRYLDAYLETFLKSAELHFMVGLPVRYYIFTDQPERVPGLQVGPQRSLQVVRVEGHSRWQDISMTRMKTIADTIETTIRGNSTHVFCMDVDQVFMGRFGSEALADSVALLHAWYYHAPKSTFTYDRNPKSSACMVTGDFYYHAAVFGGSCDSVKALAEACYEGTLRDKEKGVEALWHDESHLNKYFWLHRPSKVLSPEYCWDPNIHENGDIRVTRLRWAPKKYNVLRPNV